MNCATQSSSSSLHQFFPTPHRIHHSRNHLRYNYSSTHVCSKRVINYSSMWRVCLLFIVSDEIAIFLQFRFSYLLQKKRWKQRRRVGSEQPPIQVLLTSLMCRSMLHLFQVGKLLPRHSHHQVIKGLSIWHANAHLTSWMRL